MQFWVLRYVFAMLIYVQILTEIFASDFDRTRVLADRICKPGPPLATSATRKNCLIIGDSISIGYTPWVAQILAGSYQVQHAPWETVNGGALDSKYGLQCLELFLSSVMLKPAKYDVIIFNFGMHDILYNGEFPEEYTPPSEYSKNLKSIKLKLLSTGARVGYVLTTPVPWNVTINDRVKYYNSLASEVMDQQPMVMTADLYTWVIAMCGEPPYNNCVIADQQPSPHYTKKGYHYLSELVKDVILKLGSDSKAEALTSWDCKEKASDRELPVPCRNKYGKVVTVCPHDSTCCDSLFSNSGKGCCLLRDAVSCGDGKHCCPAGYECDPSCSISSCFCSKASK